MVYYHYTSLSSLINIIKEKSIWATNIFYLNDETEYINAFKEITTLLVDLVKNVYKTNEEAIDFIEYISRFFDENSTPLQGSQEDFGYHSYWHVFSLSENDNVLSQWRSYCNPNNGYSIGFDIQSLYNHIIVKYPNAIKLNCIYDTKDKIIFLRELINFFSNKYRKFKIKQYLPNLHEIYGNTNAYKDEIRLLSSIYSEITKCYLTFKNHHFKEENEIRILIPIYADYKNNNTSKINKPLYTDDCLNFRNGTNCIIPYLNIPINVTDIKSITIGPTPNRYLADKALKLFIDKCYEQYNDTPETKISDIPFRTL